MSSVHDRLDYYAHAPLDASPSHDPRGLFEEAADRIAALEAALDWALDNRASRGKGMHDIGYGACDCCESDAENRVPENLRQLFAESYQRYSSSIKESKHGT